MLAKPSTCQLCPLENANGGFAHPDGRCRTSVLIIGEALGDREKFDGLCFRPYAEAGSALMTAIRLLGLKREDFAYWNMIGCQPPYNNLENTSYEYEAINHCKVHFKQVLERYKPKVILALGNVPLKHLRAEDQETLDYIQKLELSDPKKLKDYLKKFKISSLRGYIFDSIYGIPMIPSLHPSFITREGRIYIGVLMRDIKTAVELAQGNIPQFKTQYITEPTIQDAKYFYEHCKRNPTLAISHDIETPETTLTLDESEIEYENIEVRDIDSIQFTTIESEGIFFPWYGEFQEYAKKILALPNPKVGWNNVEFDKTHLEYHLGKGAIAGLNIDTMHLWKWLNQDFVKMGRGLQFATNFFAPEFPAWKHLSQLDPKRYGVLDVDATLRIYNGLQKDLSHRRLLPDTKSLWEGFIDDIVKLRPILDDIQKRGFPINPIEREKFKKLIEEEREETLAKLQDLYPTQLRRVTPAEGYKFVPKEVAEVDELFTKAENVHNKGLFYIVEDQQTVELRKAQYLEEHTRRHDDEEEDSKDETTGLLLKEFDLIDENAIPYKEMRYCRMKKFLPSSRNQVIDYIKLKKYKVPKKTDRERGERESTGKDEIYHLWESTNDPLFEKVIYYRELDKMLKTYVGTGKKGWKTGSDGRVHTTFGFHPATGQLSSRNPNINNVPARGTRFSSKGYQELAQQFRKTIAAASGKILLSADWSAFHANTLAFEAEDAAYMRVVQIDPHSFVAAHILSTDLQTITNKLKSSKPNDLDDIKWKIKVAIHEETIERLKTLSTWLALPEDKLAENLRFIKTNFKFVRDSMAKPSLLGLGFGMGVRKFYKLNQHTFKSEAEPKRILELIKKLFPKTFVEYHSRIKDLADRQTYLISRYGYIRRFYDVYDWRMQTKPRTLKIGEQQVKNSRGEWWIRKDGVDAEAVIAYLPANDAFGKAKEAIRDLWEHPNGNLIQSFGLINFIHDELIFEVDKDLLEEASKQIKFAMESPSHYLKNSIVPNGLITKTSMKYGYDWSSMKDLKI